MQLGLLSHGQLTFDPFKPIILRGSPTEDGSTLFAGNVVLNLYKSTKISNVSVTLKSNIMTYWPEGIGSRGNITTSEKELGEQTLQILASNLDNKSSVLTLAAGTHRFSFAFVVPNSTFATIEDTFGRVRHVVEAHVQRPGITLLSTWSVSKPVMILRTYMSNSLLTNNSLTNLSKTFEKQMVYGDIEVLIEAAAFSSGDLFYIRMIIEPTLKHTRLENMEVTVTESRRYCVPEMKAWRTDSTTFPMKFAGSVRLAEFGEVNITTDELRPAFDKTAQGIELEHTFAHRISFATPTCQQNIHHTTYVKEIQFRHHIDINLTMSYIDQDGNKQTSQLSTSGTVNTPTEPSGTLTPPPAAHFSHNSRSNSSQSIQRLSSPSTPSSSANTSPRLPSAILPATPTNTQNNLSQNSNSPGWQNMILRLSKSKGEKDGSGNGRRVETIILDTPIIVFDCRLKEDYGRLPSYSELGTKFSETTEYPSDKQEMKIKHKKGTIPLSMDKPSVPHPYLCPCYHAFCREMELASQALYLPAEAAPAMPLLDRIPSIPPPDYVD